MSFHEYFSSQLGKFPKNDYATLSWFFLHFNKEITIDPCHGGNKKKCHHLRITRGMRAEDQKELSFVWKRAFARWNL